MGSKNASTNDVVLATLQGKKKNYLTRYSKGYGNRLVLLRNVPVMFLIMNVNSIAHCVMICHVVLAI